jgi:hypothetical protein
LLGLLVPPLPAAGALLAWLVPPPPPLARAPAAIIGVMMLRPALPRWLPTASRASPRRRSRARAERDQNQKPLHGADSEPPHGSSHRPFIPAQIRQ